MKKIFAYITIFICVFLVFASACNDKSVQNNLDESEDIKIIVSQSPTYNVQGGNVFYADEDGNAEIKLKMNDNYFVDSVSSSNSMESEIQSDDEFTYIKLSNLKWSSVVNINCQKSDASIYYHLNGGTFKDGDRATKYKVYYDLVHHLRPNTEIGTDKIEREGYTLIGWNTKEDESGTFVGLGSRVSIEQDGVMDLYAVWSEQSPAENFMYVFDDNGGAKIVRCADGLSTITVPEYIDGYPVTSIGKMSFVNLKAETIILPKSIKTVEESAFAYCKFKELYLYDNMESISDNSFLRCTNFSTLHINAIEAPRYVSYDRHSNFADKYDILISNAENQKLIVFGGSGTYFSIDTKQIEQNYPDYVCINMGVNAYFNGVAQFEMMMPYINDGDVFIHAPEASAPQQLMYSTAMYSVAKNGDIDSRLYSAVEENYDLFTSVDIRNVTKTFDAFTYYNDGRRDLPAKSYTDYIDKIKLSDGYYYTDTGYIDNRGNYAVPLPAGGTNAITGEADIVTDYITDYTSVMRLNGYYGKLRARGAKVFLINAAVNEDILDKRINEADFSRFEKYPHRGAPIQESTVEDWVNAYDSVERKNITISCILSLKDCLYPSEYFSNSDYHLSSDGREIHTAKIIDALSKVL